MTRDPEQPDDTDTEPTGGDGPVVRNTTCGVVGALMQAGVVHGDVHLHSPPPPPPAVVPRQWRAALALFAWRGRTGVLLAASLALVVATAATWMVLASKRPAGNSSTTELQEVGTPSGQVRIRLATTSGLCLTDGLVRDGRYGVLVAVQRPCTEVAPQTTRLEPADGDTRRIQWHHPDHGIGCLKALAGGPGTGLLEPWKACDQASQFHLDPVGPRENGTYVLRVDGQGCVSIADTFAGTEAVMERCAEHPGQIFVIESVG